MFRALKLMFSQWNNFSGRTSRRDYWMALLGNVVFAFILGAVSGILGAILAGIDESLAFIASLPASIYSLLVVIPAIAMHIRRMHDIGKPGITVLWCYLGSLCCGIGSIVLLVFACLPGQQGPNQYGPDPKGFNGGNQQFYGGNQQFYGGNQQFNGGQQNYNGGYQQNNGYNGQNGQY